MISRVREASGLKSVMDNTEALKEVNCDMDRWIADDRNVAYSDGSDNYGAFEYNRPGVYTGHYFFGSARGRKALNLAEEIIQMMFDEHDAKVIVGLTPVTHKAALWMNRQLGFKEYGEVNTEAGLHRIVIKTY